MSGEHALDMISEIVHEASCPVIALIDADAPIWFNEAAKRGIFAYIVEARAEEMQSAIDIMLRRFSEYPNLEARLAACGHRACQGDHDGASRDRRATAFEFLRSHSQRSGRKLYDVAERSLTATCCSSRPSAPRPRA